ncbi:MAG: Gfo/Idh/MocA family oxidoreductase [Anaerolineae bacterium]|nr:Gfo/Idh/MocA family oxidoreductase [Anaerolineae bacterium]
MSEPIRVAVVGLGIGQSHLTAYQELPDQYQVVAVCDVNVERGQQVAAQFGGLPLLTRFEDVLARDEVEVVDLCTPPFLHFEQIQAALAAGKHVACEKPLVGSLREVDALQAASDAAGRVVMPIFQYRFGHGLQKLKWLVERGVAGQAYVSTVETMWRRRAAYYAVPWRGRWATELGGTLLGHALHTHDMLTYILGPVARVYARASTRVNAIETEDCAAITLEMADGSLATCAVTLGSSEEISRHRFCFSELTAESNTRPYTNSHEPWTFTPDTPEAAARIETALAEFDPLPERFPGQFYRFYQALRHGAPLPVTLGDARQALELVTAMYYSSATAAPVTLPLGPDHPYYPGWQPTA